MLKSLFFSLMIMLSLIAVPTSHVYAASSIGRIVHTYGPAWVQRGTTREKAARGQVVLRNDSIVTGSRGRVKIVMGDGSKVYIGAKSRVSLRKYSLRGTKLLNASIHMLWGKARFFVNKLTTRGSSFRVRTPTAVLGVRGTEFIVLVPPTPELLNRAFDNITLEDVPQLPTRTILSEGAVDVSVGSAAPERLLPGHTALVDKGGKVMIRETGEDDAKFKGEEDAPDDLGKEDHQSKGKPTPPTVRDHPRTPRKGDAGKKPRREKGDRPHLEERPQDAVNAVQNLNNTTEIIIKPSFVAPDTAAPAQ
jgi:hypothetical protein